MLPFNSDRTDDEKKGRLMGTDSAQKALQQIKEKNYAGAAYRNKRVLLIGLRIDFSERNIVQDEAECL